VISDRYCATLRSPEQSICRIRPEGQDVITSLKFTAVAHPPYSPNLAPSEFWLFPKLKETLKGQHFLSDAELEEALCKWISGQQEIIFMDGMKKRIK